MNSQLIIGLDRKGIGNSVKGSMDVLKAAKNSSAAYLLINNSITIGVNSNQLYDAK